MNPSNAIILAAGKGGRLYPETAEIPKALLRIGLETIIEFQVRVLKAANIQNITVVTGFKGERIRETLSEEVRYAHNERHAETNSLYSLWVAKHCAPHGGLILNGDVLFDPALLMKLLEDPSPDALLVDFRDGLGDEEMKVITRGGIVSEISKQIDPVRAEGENVGIIKTSAAGFCEIIEVAEASALSGHWNLWTPHAIQSLIGKRDFAAISTGDFPWIEIDYPHDLERARCEIYPRIMEKNGASLEEPDSRRDPAAPSPI